MKATVQARLVASRLDWSEHHLIHPSTVLAEMTSLMGTPPMAVSDWIAVAGSTLEVRTLLIEHDPGCATDDQIDAVIGMWEVSADDDNWMRMRREGIDGFPGTWVQPWKAVQDLVRVFTDSLYRDARVQGTQARLMVYAPYKSLYTPAWYSRRARA